MQHIVNNSIDLCFLQETYMNINDTAIFNEVKEMGMKMYSVPRKSGGHGGLGLIYNPNFNIKLIGNSVTLKKYKTFEYIEFTMKSNKGLIRFCNLYRRPYSKKHRFTVTHFLVELEEYLELVVNKPGLPIVLGDLNVHLEKNTDKNTIEFKNIFEQFGFIHNEHSLATHKLGGELDVIFCTEFLSPFISDVVVYPDGTPSDHYMLSCNLLCDPELYESNSIIKYRNFKSMNVEQFKCGIRKSHLSDIVNLPPLEQNIDLIAHTYNEELKKLMDKHCPVIVKRKKTSKSGKRDVWFDTQLQNLLRETRKAERKWYKYRNSSDKIAYKHVQSRYMQMVKDKRKESNANQILTVKKDKKKLFKTLNKMLGKEKTFLPDCNSNKELSENFASYFTSKITKIRDEIDKESTIHNNILNGQNGVCSDCLYYGERLLEFTPLSLDDLHKLVFKMSDKFCCLDPIPTWLLKDCFDELGPILLKLVNLSLKFGKFPDCFKKAVVKPTVKDLKGPIDSLSNYRPVSNISFVSKIIEKAVLKELDNYLVINNLYCSNQSGYRRFHSCETLNIKLFNDILKSIDEGSTVALLLLDMSAAFDTVDHTLLLEVLNKNYGIDNTVLKWFKDYLHNRSCSVNILDSFSDVICLLFGVPQGSILGPILFILYTKHLQHIAKRYGLSIQLYADDNQIYIAFNKTNTMSSTTCKENIENCLTEIKSWMCAHYLKMNEGKTKLLFLNKPFNLRENQVASNFTLTTCDVDICEFDWLKEEEVKSLGVHLDPYFKMDKQISSIKKFCYGQLISWKRIAPGLTEDVKTLLVNQIILSKIDYNNALLAGLPNSSIKGLQMVVNSAIRFIYGLRWRDHITPHIIKSHILPVKYRIDFKISLIVYNCLAGFAPKYVQDLLKWNVPTRNTMVANESLSQIPRATQDSFLLVIPIDFGCKTRYRSRTFSHYAPRCWNKLPFHLRACQNRDTFKTGLKTFLFKQFLTDNGLNDNL